MGIVRLGGAFQHHNLSPRAALRSRRKRGPSVCHIARHVRGASACASVREIKKIKISGTAWSGSMSTETDRGRYGNNCWGINQLGMLFFFFSPTAWVRRAAMEAKWRIRFTPLQTCLSLSPLLCGEGVKSVWRQFKVLSHLTVSQTYLPPVVCIFSLVCQWQRSGQNKVKSMWGEEWPRKEVNNRVSKVKPTVTTTLTSVWFFPQWSFLFSQNSPCDQLVQLKALHK